MKWKEICLLKNSTRDSSIGDKIKYHLLRSLEEIHIQTFYLFLPYELSPGQTGQSPELKDLGLG